VGTSGGLQYEANPNGMYTAPNSPYYAGPNAKYGHYQPGDPNDLIAMLNPEKQQQQPGYSYLMS